MTPAQPTPDEPQRLQALRRYGVLDTAPEQALDDLAALAAQICGTPIALISLLDEHRQWFKAKIGFDVSETPRAVSFCGHAVQQTDLFVVPDARQDTRFSDNPLVTGEASVRFYAGAPLMDPASHALGALCVMDRVPRVLSEEQRRALGVLARQVVTHLELHRHARDLYESNERFRNVVRATNDTVWDWDLETDELWWNEGFLSLVGSDPKETAPNLATWSSSIHPQDVDRVVQGVRHLLSTGDHLWSAQYRIRHHQGHFIEVLDRGCLIRDSSGKPRRMVGAMQDVTMREKHEALTRRLASIVEFSDDAIIGKDLSGIITSWNRGAEKLFGYSADEMVGSSILRLIPPERRAEEDHILGKIRQGESLEHFETVRLTKSGRLIDVSVTASPIKDAAGLPIGVSKIARDITERRRAEERIAEQAALLDKARDAILVRDFSGKILYWNQGAERLYGWSAAEALGNDLGTLVYGEPELLAQIDRKTMEQGEWSGEVRQRAKSGHDLMVEARWTLIRDSSGRPKAALAINTDVTERKKLEAQFLRAQRMESIGTLAGGIAHDLNNILAPIMMSIDMLMLSATDRSSREILQTIQSSAQRGADIVRQVLSFARGLESTLVKVQTRSILRDFESIIRETFPKDIRLVFKRENDPWPILADPTQIHQVLLNLAVNARDAMPQGGTLTIEAHNTVLDEQYAAMNLQAKPGRYVQLVVSDTGTGMSPEIIEKIFDPFFTTKEIGKGTGLGLSTVMAIVKSHGGIINVYSEPGQGTVFKVYLPAAIDGPDHHALAEAAQEIPRGEGETILLVDDEASILTITSQTLQAFGYRVLSASDGAQAVGLYALHRNLIAAVVTDMMMPIMDGAATIHALMRIDPQVKIIAASGLSSNGDAAKAAGAGVKHFLVKPYTAETLLITLRALLTGMAARPH